VRIDELIDSRHIVVCTGAGGVGKTTTSAALALRAAERGRKTIVCTIDPARRLAQSMGLAALDNVPHRVDIAGTGRGELHAMMLDMKRTFDEMVMDMTSPDRAQAIMRNPFYEHVSSTLAGTQEYMAMEKLWELHEEGGWDLIVIDTPPTRSALDFLDAPRRLTDFLEGRFLRMMLWPYMKAGKGGLRVLNFGTQVALRAVTRVTGSELFADVAEFFRSFEGMYEEFKHRSVRVRDLLGARRTVFLVVTSPSGSSLREARFFAERLAAESMPLGGVVVNRMHVVPDAGDLTGVRAGASAAAAQALDTYERWRALARAEERVLADALGTDGLPVWRVPDLPDEVVDLDQLRTVGALLAG